MEGHRCEWDPPLCRRCDPGCRLRLRSRLRSRSSGTPVDDPHRPRAAKRNACARRTRRGGGGRLHGGWGMRLQLTLRFRMGAAVFVAWIGAARGQNRTDKAFAAASASPAAPPSGSAHLSDIDVHAVTAYGSYADTDHVFVQTPSIAGAVSNPVAGWSIGGQYLVDV